MKTLSLGQMEQLEGGECRVEYTAYLLAMAAAAASVTSGFLLALGIADLFLAADAYHECVGDGSIFR